MDDLFAATVEMVLPTIEFGPVRTPIGTIAAVLRDPENQVARKTPPVALTPRIKIPCFRLASGEIIAITERDKGARPSDVDGLLQRLPGGGLRWLGHRAIDDLLSAAQAEGWSKVVEKRAISWNGQFSFQAERLSARPEEAETPGLRPPQVGALLSIGTHWSLYRSPATIVMPTGTGKTETMLSALAVYVRKPMLVIVPSDALRKQTADKFLSFGHLYRLGVLAPSAAKPIVGIVKGVPKSAEALEIFERCNVIVATMSSLGDESAEPFWSEIAKRTGVLVIDEAHHIGAARWTKFREAFSSVPTLQFTATPFRRDGALVDGQVIYNYPLRLAQQNGYFKPISFEPVYEPVSANADMAIATAAVAKLRADLAAGFDHLMMARCVNIERALAVHALYQTLAPELRPTIIHSRQADAATRIAALREGKGRIAICVNMLGEGFDLPQLKIAAIHDLHQSLAILMQFTGRFTRSAGAVIGNATIIANVAEPNVATALERLYSEDADWNEVLSEMSSAAAKDHAKLIKFLSEAQRLDEGVADDEIPITHKLIKPTLSTLIYRATKFTPKAFHEGLPSGLVPYRVWLHAPSNTLFFVTREEPTVKWSRSKAVRDRNWALFVLHFDEARQLLYLSSSNHKISTEALAKAVGADKQIYGDIVFRALGRITRLIFQNLGVKKHGRRNLSYASYTGAEVVTALSQAEKSGSVKAMLSGTGWENGAPTTIGCSAKGRIWSRDAGGPVPRLNEWCESIGDKIVDASIDTTKLIDNVLLPTVVSTLPDAELLGIDWPVEILGQVEERVLFNNGTREAAQTVFELSLTGLDRVTKTIDFDLCEAVSGIWGSFRFALGGPNEFSVTQLSGEAVQITIGKVSAPLAQYFSDYPPLFRFVDLSELDANLHITPQTPYDLTIDDARFEGWDWDGVDIAKESIWKNGSIRKDSIQWRVASNYIAAEYDVVFDDDASGEAADLVCFKDAGDHIKLALVHCKFSGGTDAGARVADVVEVSSQAIRSARWLGKIPALVHHLKARDVALRGGGRPTRFLRGGHAELNQLLKRNRFVPVRTSILVVQPGLSAGRRTDAQSTILAAALTYLKETVGIDLEIICSP